MKQNKRSAEEKSKILEELYSGNFTWNEITQKYNISKSVLFRWKNKFEKDGIEGLKLSTGESKNTRLNLKKPKNKIEELELEIMKKDIEIARLKKGYMVKGVGRKKEYVTTLDKNTK